MSILQTDLSIYQAVSEFKKIHILGYSGHAYVVIDSALSSGFEVDLYFDLKASESNPYGLQYGGKETDYILKESDKHAAFFPAVGDNFVRKKLLDFLESSNWNQTRITHKTACVSPFSHIGNSTFIAPNAVVNSHVKVGKACIINTASVVEHECELGDFVHVAPGAVLLGSVKVGEFSLIGAGSVVRQGIRIGSGVVVGAGSVVICDVPDGEIWAGNPAKKLNL